LDCQADFEKQVNFTDLANVTLRGRHQRFQNQITEYNHSCGDSSLSDEGEQNDPSPTDELNMFQSGLNHLNQSCFRIDGLQSMIDHRLTLLNTRTWDVRFDLVHTEKKELSSEMV
jgi:hypothetical protein